MISQEFGLISKVKREQPQYLKRPQEDCSDNNKWREEEGNGRPVCRLWKKPRLEIMKAWRG